MIAPPDIEASLCSGEQAPEQLDDGFSPPPLTTPEARPLAPDAPAEQLFTPKSPF